MGSHPRQNRASAVDLATVTLKPIRFIFSIVVFVCLLAQPVSAAWTPLWSLGIQDGTANDFGSEAYPNNATPAANSAITRDDDYYFAGSYATVGSVASPEPLSDFEGAISTWDPTTRIHFQLSAPQAASTSQLRFYLYPIWSGYSNGRNFGSHTLTVKINGVTILNKTFTFSQMLTAATNAISVNAVAGENVMELTRSGGVPDAWFSIDTCGMTVNATALVDADGDGLPQWWEEGHGLSDNIASEATLDSDHDGLTTLQEFTKGTNPNLADTDSDGLNDGAETTTNPLLSDTDGDSIKDGAETSSNPLLIDSDNDGAPDAWELRVGTNPASATSFPPPFTAAIGVKFSSENAPLNVLTPYQVTGLVPQMNWNNTLVLSQWDAASIAGTTADITSPSAGVLKNSAGSSSLMTVTWAADATWSSGNSGGSNQDLLNGGLWVNGDTPASVTFSSIPYASYDVLVYVGNTYQGAVGFTQLNDGSDKYFSSASVKPQSEFIEPLVTTSTRPWRGNVIRYRNVTGSSCNVKLYRTSGDEVGLHAIQIVDSILDSDGDGMPDWFEVMNKLRPNFNDAALDPDGEGLSNLNEFTRGTDSNKADTDGDGLSDAVETNTGIYLSATNTGSNPLMADTDGDGLNDGAEVTALPAALNPNLADSDGDGRSDGNELAQHRDPLGFNSSTFLMPTVNGGTSKTYDWTLNFQLVWDHEHGHTSDGEWGDTELAWIEVQNREDRPGGAATAFAIRRVAGSLTWLFYSSAGGGFSYPNQPSSDIWHSDWDVPPANLSTAMGFSGYGRKDISQRLRLRAHATTTGSASAWNLTVSLFNIDTNQTVSTQTFNGCTLAPHAHAGTATWTDANDVSNQFYIDIQGGMSLYFLNSGSSASIEAQPAFANARDTDRDGMPNAWETANSFNQNSAADAALDTDGDGLSNVREYLLGTNPRNADTDGDGAKDGVEVDARSNPLLASSKPPFWNGLPAGINGEDFNGNGISDAYEMWLGRFDLLGSADADGDGQTNSEEARAGTDPFSASSYLWADMLRSGADLTLRWPRILNKVHQVQQSDTLTAWTLPSGSPVVAGNEYQFSLPNALSGTRKFYRVSVNDVDSDNDGVSDWTEANILGTALNNINSSRSSSVIDTNGDGTPETTISGDYATLIERMQGGSSTGGFEGGAAAPTSISKAQASRFLMQATFGPTLDDIERVQQLGYEGWINEQLGITPTLHSTYIKQVIATTTPDRALIGAMSITTTLSLASTCRPRLHALPCRAVINCASESPLR